MFNEQKHINPASKILVCLFCSLIIISCRKDFLDKKYDFIYAGERDGKNCIYQLIDSNSKEIDIDNDQNIDIVFGHSVSHTPRWVNGGEYLNLAKNVFICVDSDYVSCLNKMAVIDKNRDWKSDHVKISSWGSPNYYYGNWQNKTDKYIGFKLVKKKQVYYGWIRMNSKYHYEFKDLAYME